jgi:NTE family protein
MSAVTGIQLHRYNVDTLSLVNGALNEWSAELSTPEKTVSPYFIELSFNEIGPPELRAFFNKIPTSFSLTDEQVDKLINAGRELLRDHPLYQQLLADLK